MKKKLKLEKNSFTMLKFPANKILNTANNSNTKVVIITFKKKKVFIIIKQSISKYNI